MKILSAKQVYEADKATVNKQDTTPLDLMERAANNVFQWLDVRLQGAQVPIYIFCGIGNNGGDGMALGRLLVEKKYNVHCYVVNYSDKRSKCFLINYDRFKKRVRTWPPLLNETSELPEIQPEGIVVDCIFGIGLNRPVDSWVKKLLQHINASKAFVLAIDVPSGLFVDGVTPDKDAIVNANFTLTFQVPKLVFFLPETGVFSENTEVLDIGLDTEFLQQVKAQALLVTKSMALQLYQPRKKFSHKNMYGHSLIVGGSYGMVGAPTLSAKACLATGSGKVTALIPECGYTILQTSVPEVMVACGGKMALENFDVNWKPTAIGVGIGMGTSETTTKAFLDFLRKQNDPMVVDADALNILSVNKKSLGMLPEKSILTPHPGELSRLIGNWANDFEKLEKVKVFSKKYKVIVVIKGANTLIVDSNEIYVNSTGNPGMATAGSGDVLTGVITALLSQGYDPLAAAIFGVYLHGSAGDIAMQQFGYQSLTASHLIDFMGDAFLALFQNEEIVAQENKE
ncbi:MAG TPA: NAD(P)H-hydrate dehydratase [Flavobacteriaceae bacterium]|nr:NAD(P)H-hydrate dehydratase [Flavobacteriaceae bacterium]